MKTAILCSGQGSQYVGMLKDISEHFPTTLGKISLADELIGYKLSEICFDGPPDLLKETRNTQPALFLHSAVVYDLIKELLEVNAAAGHSVGEYAALYAAGVLSFVDAFKLVALRGKLMFEAGEKLPGTMFAVIGLEDEKVEAVCRELTESGNGNVVVAANFNCPSQVVVSGSAEYLRNNTAAFKQAGAKIVKELVVSGAFHSPLMKPAKEELEKAILATNFNTARIPVYSNVYAKPLTDSDELKNALIMQLESPVLWTQSIKKIYEDGINNFIEVGAGNVLQGLVKRIVSDSQISGFDKVSDITEKL
ncbi:MAG: Malonyl CoA-acyl carrier protein transacylase [Ignavibacteria bacterium]|nr:Malonyl CoA-acyl carrier protein transacylase [Ignavibacteria bacterium]